MLAFLIPVKHPARSRSYELVTELLRSTLQSIANQTVPSYRAYVVCNRVPEWASEARDMTFMEVPFPPAPGPANEGEIHTWIYRDKGCKIAVALDRALRDRASHVMVVDADDFVSHRLAEYVRSEPEVPGWYCQDGIVYSRLFKIAEYQPEFWSYCGTSHIVRADLMPRVPNFGSRPTIEEVAGSFDPWFLDNILGDHRHWQKYFWDRGGNVLKPLPFLGAVWQADTGENSSRVWWRQTRFGPIWGSPLTAEQCREFSIPMARRSVAATALLQAWRLRSRSKRLATRLLRGVTDIKLG